MARQQESKYCVACKRNTLHQRDVFGGGMGCLLTVVTGGLFIPIWIVLYLLGDRKKYRCQVCGL